MPIQMSQRDYDIQAEEIQRMQAQDQDRDQDQDQDQDDGDEDDDEEVDEDYGFMPGDCSQLFISESGLPVADVLSDCAASLAGIHAEAAKLNKILTFMAKKMK